MWTSVPQTPARRTRISTSFSRIVGSATSFSANPGPADSFTSAFTRDRSSRCHPPVRRRPARRRSRTETSHLAECDGSLTRAHDAPQWTRHRVARTALEAYAADSCESTLVHAARAHLLRVICVVPIFAFSESSH